MRAEDEGFEDWDADFLDQLIQVEELAISSTANNPIPIPIPIPSSFSTYSPRRRRNRSRSIWWKCFMTVPFLIRLLENSLREPLVYVLTPFAFPMAWANAVLLPRRLLRACIAPMLQKNLKFVI